MMRLIHETADSPGEVERRKEEMVRYMAWRSPDTLKAYEHYFQAIHHAQMQDVLHQRLDEKLKSYLAQAQQKKTSLRKRASLPPLSLACPFPSLWTDELDLLAARRASSALSG